MPAFEVVAGYVTNPSTTISALTTSGGQTFQVRAAPEGANIWLEQAWGSNTTGGVGRIRSPRMHDNVQGIRFRVPPANQRALLPFGMREPLYSQDTLIPETSGGASETDALYYLVHYSSLPGSEGNFKTWAEIKPRIKKFMGVEVTIHSGATAGQWGAAVALNSSMDQFQRPESYALLGYLIDTATGAVVFRGTNIGELRFGGPGVVEPEYTSEYFVRLSEETQDACIPEFQAANASSILVECSQGPAESEHHVTAICALL